MITARPQKNLQTAKNYFRQHLARGDYHSENRTVQGYWFGKGAERLGLDLTSPVAEEAYHRLCDNLHPLTGEALTVRHRKVNRRVLYDFVVSAPKSVSIMALTIGDRRILTAHDEAARTAMERMERVASARLRKGGARAERTTGEVVGAIFRHEESRALDPQLHSHFLFFNATWDAVEDRWKALEPSAMFDQIKLYTEIYRSELALRLRGIGYTLRTSAHGFEIEGVTPELVARFSKRRRAILEEEAKVEGRLGHSISNNGRATLAHSTRKHKRTDLTSEQLGSYQRDQLSQVELAALKSLVLDSVKASVPVEKTSPKEAIDYARDHLFERRSAVAASELIREALKFGRGTVPVGAIENELAVRTDFIAVDGTLTTKEALRQEQRLIALVNQGLGRCGPLRPNFAGVPGLTPEQGQALRFLLGSTDEVVALRGRAGTGKSRLLTELVRGIEERYAAVVLAPTGAAVEVLRKQGFRQAATVKKFLSDPDFQGKAHGKALIVDEAGFLSTSELLGLVEAARALRGRLILSGDTRQHHAVASGDALRILEKHSALRTVEIKNIQRQVDREYREAIREFSEGLGEEGLRRLEKLGGIKESGLEERHSGLPEAYIDSIKSGKSALIVSPTWREIEEVTEEIRGRLKAEGILSEAETQFETHHPLKWTHAQKRDLRNYRPGMILMFYQPAKDFRANDWGELKSVEGEMLKVVKPNGEEVAVGRKQSDCFDVAEKRSTAVAPGDRLLLRSNRKGDRLFNGQMATVREVTSDRNIILTDGRAIKPDFRAFTHGYCITSYAAQGRTVDHVYVAMDSSSGEAANLNQLYVSASRGREKIQIFTDKAEALHEAAARPGIRLSATELLESVRPALHESIGQCMDPKLAQTSQPRGHRAAG